MDNLDEIAGRVFRRNQTEDRTCSGLEAIHTSLERDAGIGIYLDIYRLPDPDLFDIRLFEIGNDPDVFQ